MKNATLRQLKVFEAVARHRSFSRAADELHLTQPAVSTQVRKLAEHAGLPLFEQLGKKIHLTPAGTQMLLSSREIIQKFQEAEEAMAQYKGVSGGRLNVSVISAGDYFFPRLLVEFAQQHAGVTLNFGVCNREELLAQLHDNVTDLAVMVRPPEDADTVAEPFAPHPYVIVAAPGHRLARTPRIPASRIVKEPFVVREKGSDTWNSMAQALGPHLHSLNVGMEIRSTETIKQAVIAGMGVSFLSAHTVSRELQAGSLVVLDVQGFPLMLNWYVVHRRAKRLPPVAQAFKSFLLQEGAGLIAQALGVRAAPAARKSARRPK
jgi:LysR family transcriptional regulator, low CO2-responsive transcriptional regulator